MRCMLVAICVAIGVTSASQVYAGNNAGGTVSLSWDEVGQITDLASVPPRGPSGDLHFPLYLHLNGASDLHELAITLTWTPNSIFGPCFYLITDSSSVACGWVAPRNPIAPFAGDSSYTETIVFPPGSSTDCVTFWVGGGACAGVAASFCPMLVLTMDSNGAVDTLAATSGATLLGGTPEGCPTQIQDVSPHMVVAGKMSSLTVRGLNFGPLTRVSLENGATSIGSSSVVLENDHVLDVGFNVPASFGGPASIIVATDASQSDTLTGHLLIAQPTPSGGAFGIMDRTTQSTEAGGCSPYPAPRAFSTHAWGDYNNDGSLDLLLTGSQTGDASRPMPTTELYQNDGTGCFLIVPTSIPALWLASAQWGDYNNDGRLDLLLVGQRGALNSTPDSSFTGIFRNNGNGTFTQIASGLPAMGAYSSARWADFDHDGRLDVVLTGTRVGTGGFYSAVFHNNDDGTFSEITPGVNPVGYGVPLVVDLDNDGSSDLVLDGYPQQNVSYPAIYRNNWPSPGFTWKNALYGEATGGSTDAADYNLDGRFDLYNGTSVPPSLWRNDGGFALTRVIGDTTFASGSVGRWADVDNDGRPDLLVPDGSWVDDEWGYRRVPINVIYHNDSDSAFSWRFSWLPGIGGGDASWADVNNDGYLEFLVSGTDWNGGIHTVLGAALDGPVNSAPTAPTGLAARWMGYGYQLSWKHATDAQTPAIGLTYNVRVGTMSGGWDVVSPMADPGTGYRRVVAYGNAQNDTSFIVCVPPGTYYWSVQAVDGRYAGGPWSSESYFTATLSVGAEVPRVVSLRVDGAAGALGSVWFEVAVPQDGAARLELFDISGRRVETLLDGGLTRGNHRMTWNPSQRGDPAGVYFARLESCEKVCIAKVVVLH